MAVLNQNISLSAGDSVQVRVSLKDVPDDFEMDGVTIVWSVGSNPTPSNSSRIVLSKSSSSNEIVISESDTGYMIVFDLSFNDTIKLGGQRLYHEMVIKTVDGGQIMIMSGHLSIAPVLNR